MYYALGCNTVPVVVFYYVPVFNIQREMLCAWLCVLMNINAMNNFVRICLSVCLIFDVSVHLSCLFLYVCLPVFQSVCLVLLVCLSLSVCEYVCRFLLSPFHCSMFFVAVYTVRPRVHTPLTHAHLYWCSPCTYGTTKTNFTAFIMK